MPTTPDKLEAESSHTLCLLLTAMAGVDEESERVRIATTGIPSLLRCGVSGSGIRAEDGDLKTALYEKNGSALPSKETTAIFADLNPVIQRAMERGRVVVSESIPPSLEKRGVACLTVVPLETLHKKYGFLLLGREGSCDLSQKEDFLLRALGQHLAIGIENLRLHRAQEKQSELLQKKVEESTSQLRLSEERQRMLLNINNAIVAKSNRDSLLAGDSSLSLDEIQKQHILLVLEQTGGRVSGDRGAAKILGLKPSTLESRMKKLGIRRKF